MTRSKDSMTLTIYHNQIASLSHLQRWSDKDNVFHQKKIVLNRVYNRIMRHRA
jgi:transcription initiation factor TFIIIB Brf1 subunit/transcription initiation factor TFIIB